MSTIKLYEFPVSHYCEKVRWALDYKKLPYRSKTMVPVFHIPPMLALTRQMKVPVIQLDGKMIPDSPKIIDALEQRFPAAPSLYPASIPARDRVLELAAFFDKEIGPSVRRAAYFHALPDRGYIYRLLGEGHGTASRALLKVALPAVVQAMQSAMSINETAYRRSLDKLNKALDRLDTAIRPSGYLVGNEFTVADLTAASLLAPLVRPENSFYAKPSDPPDALVEFCDSYRQRPFFEWVKDIYRKHR